MAESLAGVAPPRDAAMSSYTPPMFEVSAQRTFRASHALMIRGEREPVHWHDWVVVVTIAGDTLDDDGMLLDFHALERSLDGILGPWIGKHLNDVLPPPFSNASAELVAQCIGEAVARTLPAGARLANVRVTEAPNCVATFVAG